jgi:putative transposase
MKTYKYRIYPTKKQALILADTLESCRRLYNCALEQRKIAYRQFGVSLRYVQQAGELQEIKVYYPEYRQIHSQVLQNVLKRVDTSLQNFYRRVKTGDKPGYPRYKGYGWYDSFTYPQSGFSLSDTSKGNQRVKFSKVGEVKIRIHRAISGNIKTCTIKRELNSWYVCLACEVGPEKLAKTYRDVGIDVGIEKFAALSDGKTIANPQYLRHSEDKLKHEQRNLSRKKQKLRLAKVHQKIKNQRNDFIHKESYKLVNYYDIIVLEDLQIKNMVKNRHLAKSISDVSWNKFIQYTTYKAASAGKEVILVNPRNTSQMCSQCGNMVKKSLAVRVHKCPTCGLILDRDLNAAINILRLGISPGGVTAIAG